MHYECQARQWIERNVAHKANEAWICPGDNIVLFVSNLGGVSILGMGAVVEQVQKDLGGH